MTNMIEKTFGLTRSLGCCNVFEYVVLRGIKQAANSPDKNSK